MSEGKIIQVIGPVVDVEFEGDLPEMLTALLITNPAIDDTEDNLVVEVAQHLGDNVVRTIAMDVTDGLVRGQVVKNTGKPIQMPVGDAGLGRGVVQLDHVLVLEAYVGHLTGFFDPQLQHDDVGIAAVEVRDDGLHAVVVDHLLQVSVAFGAVLLCEGVGAPLVHIKGGHVWREALDVLGGVHAHAAAHL